MSAHRTNENGNQERTMDTVSYLLRALRRTPALGALLVAGTLVLPTGCGDVLDVQPPDLIPAEGLADPENAELLLNGAIGDFECAFGAYVTLTGVMAHEMIDATQTAARWPYDRRNVIPNDALYGTSSCSGMGIYTPLSTARWSADYILEKLQGWTDAEVANRQELIAKAAVFSGYSHLLLAEAFCTVAIDLSGELSSSTVTEMAIARFDTAIQAAQAAGTTDVINLARVGRARAYLGLGQGSNALADAQAVPADFEYMATASGDFSRRANRVYAQNGLGSSAGTALSVGEAYRSLTYNGQPDPRVPVSDFIRVNTDGTDLYLQLKYMSLDDPLPIATGDEAQLIVAEVQGGQTAVDIINDLHAAVGLDPFPGGSASEIAAQVIEERNRELWLEGHRFFDIRRLSLPLVPAPGTPYRKGGTYGDNVCFPLPDVEVRNNPNVG
ncbi:MAG: RagB/SusD family nutrient uptake outer membrane protein [Gemmatimonadota bacterium]